MPDPFAKVEKDQYSNRHRDHSRRAQNVRPVPRSAAPISDFDPASPLFPRVKELARAFFATPRGNWNDSDHAVAISEANK